MKRAKVIRQPDLTIDVRGATLIGGARLSVMSAVITETSPTLAGSVRGAKPDTFDAPATDAVSKTARLGQPRRRVVRQVLNAERRG